MATFRVIRVSDGAEVSFTDVCKKTSIVVDFWNTLCERCPAALTELNSRAPPLGAKHVACALSTGENADYRDFLQVRELSEEFPNLEHYFVPFKEKEIAKAELRFNMLPFSIESSDLSFE